MGLRGVCFRGTCWGDPQQEEPVGWCPRCVGEIYRYDIVGEVEGTLVHEECLEREEWEVVSTGEAVDCIENGGRN